MDFQHLHPPHHGSQPVLPFSRSRDVTVLVLRYGCNCTIYIMHSSQSKQSQNPEKGMWKMKSILLQQHHLSILYTHPPTPAGSSIRPKGSPLAPQVNLPRVATRTPPRPDNEPNPGRQFSAPHLRSSFHHSHTMFLTSIDS